MGKYQINTKSVKSKTSTSSKSIQRFLNAHRDGVISGSRLIKYGKNYNMDRSGVKFEVVLKELQDEKNQKKKRLYLVYFSTTFF